jgi:hypothetical protein
MDKILRPTDIRELPSFAERESLIFNNYSENCPQVLTAIKKSESNIGAIYAVIKDNQIIHQKKYKIANYCTAFQTELFVINQALDQIISKKYSEVNFMSKSESILKALAPVDSTHQIVAEIQQKCRKLFKKNTLITFSRFVSDYLGIYFELKRSAEEAAHSHNKIAYDMISMNSVKKACREANIAIWNSRWQTSDTGRNIHEIIPTVELRVQIKRHFKADYFVTQAITGHSSCREYLSRFKCSDNEFCLRCSTIVDDFKHRLLDCDRFITDREVFKEALRREGIQWPIQPKDIINKRIFKHFIGFSKQIF